jgi:predicted amino acid dehydrogenase
VFPFDVTKKPTATLTVSASHATPAAVGRTNSVTIPVVRWLDARQLRSLYGYVFRSIDSDPNQLTTNSTDRDSNVITDVDGFLFSATQHQH